MPVLLPATIIAAIGLAANPPTPRTEPPVTVETTASAVTASNTFGVNLFRTLAAQEGPGNVFVSPYSMSVALTMAAEGARGQTETEMSTLLAFPTPVGEGTRAITPVHTAHAALAKHLAQAAGTTDPDIRARIADLRAKLKTENDATDKLSRGDDWRSAQKHHEAASRIAKELNGLLVDFDRFDLRVANALWVERSFSLVPEYVSTIDRFYGTGAVTPLNMRRAPEDARRQINKWVEDHTENRIKDLLPSGSINAATRLVITNAVYFRGEWANPFKEPQTRDEEFTLAGAGTAKVRMMHDPWRGQVPYAAFNADGSFFETPTRIPVEPAKQPPTYPAPDGFTMIEIPYKGNELSMVIVAPRSPSGLPAVEAKLTATSLADWLAHLNARTVDTAVPRFKMEFQKEMSSVLTASGMRRAFASTAEKSGAEFPGISEGTDPAQQLYIGAVLHKAWIEVTEKGTEAAAATAIPMTAGAPVHREETIPFNPVFRADHPFLFLIRDTKSGIVLFIGRMVNPAG